MRPGEPVPPDGAAVRRAAVRRHDWRRHGGRAAAAAAAVPVADSAGDGTRIRCAGSGSAVGEQRSARLGRGGPGPRRDARRAECGGVPAAQLTGARTPRRPGRDRSGHRPGSVLARDRVRVRSGIDREAGRSGRGPARAGTGCPHRDQGCSRPGCVLGHPGRRRRSDPRGRPPARFGLPAACHPAVAGCRDRRRAARARPGRGPPPATKPPCHPPPDYPQPATLQSLAAVTAAALRARGQDAIRLGYDTSLFTGPAFASGWSPSYVTSGNVTAITSLEVDQGRLTRTGMPQDADDPANNEPRSTAPAANAAAAFARFLTAAGIRVLGPATQAHAAAGSATLASVSSPPVAEIVQWMLTESNNVIAEDLARQVAIATGHPAPFSGAAGAELAVLRGVGVIRGGE